LPSTSSDRSAVLLLAAAWIVFVAVVYLPDAGRGFLKDDFGWIEQGRAAAAHPLRALVPQSPGFYRPLVAFTFGGDYAWHGAAPRGYGLTNVALYLGCLAAIFILSRSVTLSPIAAAAAAFTWGVNPHGINMALMWISGRTSLLLTLFALVAAIALVRRWYALLAAALVCALGSKEEAAALPVILLAWRALMPGREGQSGSWWRDRRVWMAITVPVAVWLIARSASAAFTPGSAPPFYRLTFAPLAVLRNAAEYVDRGATIALVMVLIACATFWARPIVDPKRARMLAACALWFAGGFAATVWLPIRSSLYAVFPSVGAAIATGILVDGLRAGTGRAPAAALRFAAAASALLVAAIHTYSLRNDRWVEPARFSHRALQTIAAGTSSLPDGSVVVLVDEDNLYASFRSSFGTFAGNAVRLQTGRALDAWIEPAPADAALAGLAPPDPSLRRAAFATGNGRVYRTQ
jgi:hypothetical protein